MIPETVAALYAFLGLVTPGLVYQLLRERDRPALDESAFREASRVALTSAVFTTFSVATLAVVRILAPTAIVDVGQWLERGTSYAAGNIGLVVRTAIYEVALACLYAAIACRLLHRFGGRDKPGIVRNDVWYQVLVRDAPHDRVAWVLAKLTDGTRVWGHVDFLTVGASIEDTHLSLKGPKLTIKDSDATDKKEEAYWQRIVVRASDVSLIKVAYEPKAGTKTSGIAAEGSHAGKNLV